MNVCLWVFLINDVYIQVATLGGIMKKLLILLLFASFTLEVAPNSYKERF
ncbi:hypothetical protein AGMMS50255_8310 [Spirochaetia bacterium]|nr:hypothetical protein AGMMS50255_8310 [Spirochaetia bacterium]